MDVLVPLISIGVFGSLAIYACVLRLPEGERNWLLRLLLFALLLRLGTAALFGLAPSTRFSHEDADGYEVIGLALANAWRGEGPPLHLAPYAGQNYGYFYICGALYSVFGRFPVVPAMFNGLLGTLTVFLIYRLTRRFFHVVVARRTALLISLMPSTILWNSVAIKDTVVTLLLVFSLLSCVRLKQRFSMSAFWGTVLPLVALQPIRFYMVYFLSIAIVASLLFDRGARFARGLPKLFLLLGGAALVIALVGLSSSTQEGVEFLDLSRVASYRQGMATTAHSGFAADADVSTPAGALAILPLGLAVLLLGPFPWQLTSLRALFAMPETLLWWALIPSLIRGLRYTLRNRFSECSPVILFAGLLTPAYALVHGNVGSGFRQRSQIFVFLFIFVAVGQYLKRCRRQRLDERLLLGVTPPAPPATVAR
jgi:hypothetical protein